MSETRHVTIDAEELSGHSYPYVHDISLVEDVDLRPRRPGRTSTGWRTSIC